MKVVGYLLVVAIAIVSNVARGVMEKQFPIASVINSAIILTLLGLYFFM